MKLKSTILAASLLMGWAVGHAQEYKITKSTGTLNISEVNHVTIEGSSGSEIVFTSADDRRDRDDRAKGLKMISTAGVEDNTGIGLSVIDNGTSIEVRQLKKMDGPNIKILVPKGVKVNYDHSSPHGGEVKLKNVESSINISTVHNGVHLDNVTGPVTVKTVHGDIEAIFTDVSKNQIDLSSVHGSVSISIPVTSKVNLKMGTGFGELYVDPDFKLEIEKKGDMVRYSDHVSAKLNGGGLEINLTSEHNNIYLRKK